MNIFHLASDLGPTSTGRRLALVLPKLKDRGVTQTLAVIGPCVPFGRTLLQADIPPKTFRVRDAFDLSGLLTLRRYVLQSKPSVIHFWGDHTTAVQYALRKSLLHSETIAPIILSSIIDCPILAPNQLSPTRQETRKKLGLSSTARVIVVSDRLDIMDPIRNAAWAIDLLKPTSSHYQLVVLGDGPARGKVEAFARKLGGADDRTRLLSTRDDVRAILAAADVVWNTRTRGGLQFTAEAMAHGLPVIGFRKHAGLKPFLHEDINGYWADNTFKLASRTQKLFDDDARRHAMGDAAKAMIGELTIDPDTAADQLLKAYRHTIRA